MAMLNNEEWTVSPGSTIKIIKWWDESLPVGTSGTITGVGKRPNGVNYYNVKWNNGIENYIYDALLYNHCVKV